MSKINLRFLLQILLLLTVISFFADKAVYYSLNALSKRVYTGQGIGKLNHFLKIKDSVDLIVLGNSRANHNIDCKKLNKKSFNMGIDGRAIVYSTALTKLLSTKEQTLLIQIDPENAVNETYVGEDIESLKVLYNSNPIIHQEIKKLGLENPFQDFFYTISYNSKSISLFFNYIRPKYDVNTYYGYDPIEVSAKEKEVFLYTLKQKKNSPCVQQLKVNPVFNSCIIELIETAIRNHKKIIFFTSPSYDDQCKNDNLFLKNYMKSKNLAYYDFTDYFAMHNSIDYWKDDTHLSNVGAELFTEEIKKLLASVK